MNNNEADYKKSIAVLTILLIIVVMISFVCNGIIIYRNMVKEQYYEYQISHYKKLLKLHEMKVNIHVNMVNDLLIWDSVKYSGDDKLIREHLRLVKKDRLQKQRNYEYENK